MKIKKKGNILLFTFSVAVLPACSTTPPPARLTLGVPAHDKEVSGLVVFPARLSNTSKHPIWYEANIVPQMPYYRAFTRSSIFSKWKELPYNMCGVGATAYEIAPGASMSFSPVAPLDEAGHQYRVQLSVTQSRNREAKPLRITSETTTIR